MSKWLRKALPITRDIRPAECYDGSWQNTTVATWLRTQHSLLDAGSLTDRPDMLTPYNTDYAADAVGLSAYGGMSLFIAFTQKIGLAQALRQHLHMPKRESRYNPVQLAECMVDAIVCGISRIENTNLLKDDPLLPRARGLERFPDHATTHRYITAFEPETVAQVHRVASALFLKANRPRNPNSNRQKPLAVTLDFDATDAVVYGQQEEAAFGHKNARDGHREYCVETCFLGCSRDVLHHQVRRGNASSNALFADFYREAVRRLPEGMTVGLVRTDAGYFSLDNLAVLDTAAAPYVVGCTPYAFLLEKAYAKNQWQRISPDEEVSSIEHAFSDGVLRRVLIARHPDPKKTKAKDNGQLPLMEGLGERERYKHFACVTMIRNKSANVLWQSYAGRSNMENAIKESKLGFGLETLPSKRFAANQAYVAFVFLAYNLINWFKRYAFGQSEMVKRQIKAIRQWVLCVPAIVERHADRWRLRLPTNHPSLGLFHQIQAFLAKGAPTVT